MIYNQKSLFTEKRDTIYALNKNQDIAHETRVQSQNPTLSTFQKAKRLESLRPNQHSD